MILDPPILVVGMARSGTTLVTNLLGATHQFHVEVEPHALWKSGNYKYFDDQRFDTDDQIANRIRTNFLRKANGQRILEKSPINCIRPELVHKVFPEARVIYVERDPVRCIHSNYKRSIANDSFKPSITFKKYFSKTGGEDLPFAISKRKLFSQIYFSDLIYFVPFLFWMLYNRNFRSAYFPFGPKLSGFIKKVKENGLLAYHVEVYKYAMNCKEKYSELYRDQFFSVKLEDLFDNQSELEKMYQFANVQISASQIIEIFNAIDSNRKELATEKSNVDDEIQRLLNK